MGQIGGEVAIPRVTTGTSVGGWPQRSGPPSDIFSELANLDDSVISDPFDDLNDAGFEDDRAGKRVEGHDWWDYDDATQRNDDRGGFRAAANATEAVDLSGTEQMQMQASDLAAPPTSTKPSDLDSLDGPDSDAYEAALYAFFDAPGQKDNAGDEPGGTDTIDPEYDDGPRSRRERSTKRKRSNARRSKDSEAVEAELFAGVDAEVDDGRDDVDRWVEGTTDTHADWLERTKRSTFSNLLGILIALAAIIGVVLATVWLVGNMQG